MASVEKNGKTVDEAVAEALKELNITAAEAVIEVINECRKGIFGMFGKDAKVRVSTKEEVAAQATEAAATAQDSAKEALEDKAKSVQEAAAVTMAAAKELAGATADALSKKAADFKVEAAQKAADFKVEADAKAAEFKAEATQRAADAKAKALDSAISALEGMREGKEAPAKEAAERPAREPRQYVVSDEAVNTAKEFLQRVFKAMKIEVAMEKFINKNDGSVTFKLHGDDMGILIGKHGQTLDSLQYLTNLVANKNSNERVRVIIDVEDYRDRRVETLTRLARRLADKVKRTGERVALEPMNPHERKIIHVALQSDRRVTTLSEGDEPHRHVVIELKK